MDCTKTGERIRLLRLEKNLTQKQLADLLYLSDKTISKWERGLGCPDVSLLADLSALLGVTIEEMLEGRSSPHEITGGNMKQTKYYFCPACGNLTLCTGEAAVSCCGRKLEAHQPQKADEAHRLTAQQVEDEWYITTDHPMTKDHYLSCLIFATGNKLELIKQYPEWDLSARIARRGHGMLLWYCVQHGLFYQLL